MASETKKSRLSKSHCKNETEVDRISDLPGNVIDQIFSYLSIRDSARTSLLSTKWRHKWEAVPNLVFGDESLSFNEVEELVSKIDRILMFHVGPIHMFDLCIESEDIPFEEMDKWVLYLSRNSIKQLVLATTDPDGYSIPACLYSCQTLQHLKISNCRLSPPSKFKGFKNLKSLHINDSYVDPNVVVNLISGSTLLENLALTQLEGISHLNVNVPNLRSFEYIGLCLGVSFNSSPLLSVLSITDSAGFSQNRWYERLSNGNNFFYIISNLPLLRSLTIRDNYFPYFVGGEIPKELPIKYINLLYLRIDINPSSFKETSGLLCILRSSPNLKEVRIGVPLCPYEWYFKGDGDDIVSSIRDVGDFNFRLSSLQLFKMCYFFGSQDENDLIKFVLLFAPNLNSCIIQYFGSRDGDAKSEMLKKLLRLKRASPQAEIIFLER